MPREAKIVVFDGWLETLGGGERQVLSAASALRTLGKVSVVSHRPLHWATVVERAAVDLDGVRFHTLPERPQLSGRHVAGNAHLFVNGTHHSAVDGRGVPSIRFVYFPARQGNRARRMSGRALRGLGRVLGAACECSGWFGTEVHQGLRYRQSDGDGRINVSEGTCVRLWLSAMSDIDPSYTIRTGAGDVVAEGLAGAEGDFAPSPWVEVPPGCGEVVVHSAATLGTNARESRLLGLALGSIEEQGPIARRLFQRSTRRLAPVLGAWASDDREERYTRALRSYDVVTPNSYFTASWLEQRWGVTGPVIEPPAVAVARRVPEPGPLIMSVGRFFVGGHNKKHLAMVSAFRKLCDRGLVGWRLALVGGVGHRPADSAYLREVREAARGLPIDIYPNADEATSIELRQHAAIGWHAAGFGESERRTPERFEHFGMSVAELMISGAVPVVFDGGGLREIVEPGSSGYRWRTLDELADFTLALARNGRRRKELGEAARRRAERWSLANYERRIVALAREVMDARNGRPQAHEHPPVSK